MSNELFDIPNKVQVTAKDIYHLTVCDGAVPVADFSCDHIKELKGYDLVEATGSEPCDSIYMTRKGMDWLENVIYCEHRRCGGNYEDIYCRDCGADYNNGRLL
jgi:hypothetical protein